MPRIYGVITFVYYYIEEKLHRHYKTITELQPVKKVQFADPTATTAVASVLAGDAATQTAAAALAAPTGTKKRSLLDFTSECFQEFKQGFEVNQDNIPTNLDLRDRRRRTSGGLESSSPRRTRNIQRARTGGATAAPWPCSAKAPSDGSTW